MGWAARAQKTPGIRPQGTNYRKKLGVISNRYRVAPTFQWDSKLKALVECGHCLMRKIRVRVS